MVDADGRIAYKGDMGPFGLAPLHTLLLHPNAFQPSLLREVLPGATRGLACLQRLSPPRGWPYPTGRGGEGGEKGLAIRG